MKTLIIQNCPICNNSSKSIGVTKTINPVSDKRPELRCCKSCGHWWHSPVPRQEDLNKMYDSASAFVVSEGAKESYQRKTVADGFHHYVLSHTANASGNYLEIGPGGGALLRCFRKKNYTCYGVDPGNWIDDPSIVNSLDDLPPLLRYDVFVLQDVLEHILDPVGLMKRLKEISRKNSVFFCSFPCNDSRPARKYKEKWCMVRPYGHLHYFSLDSAKKMLSLAGLTIQNMRMKRTVPIQKSILSIDIRGLIYEVVKGGKDQVYVQAVVQSEK